MPKLHLNIEINATPEKIWHSITNKESYKVWTSAFQGDSTFEGGWKKGDSMQFTALNAHGEAEGIGSIIVESVFPKHLSIKHIGEIKNGVLDTTSEAVLAWAPAFENYTLSPISENTTNFELEMDVMDEYFEMMRNMWLEALVLLKKVSEAA